jgi:serine/threonine protein kinase/tetratricopeptide (TPR) repeat protein
MTEIESHARSLFLAALERAPAQWAAFLDEACGDNADLWRRVEQLLRAHAQMGSIHGGGAEAPAATVDEPIREGPGTAIGPYKLLEQIGEGGFGIVFMAEQHEPLRRKVALKVLKPGMDTRQVIARFEAERQALALMDHPHIAKVLEAGQTSSGRPYFVMDLVKGVPITEFCDQGQLTTNERLELFSHVCQAVQHAHQKGIIHRDLKPSNVLVTLQDGTPLVKVIDFGIAKALGQRLTDKSLFTGFAQLIGTPLYMSPEQAALSNVDVDTRSDIYSLGVLLYELLTGTTPFDKERLRTSSFDEIRRIIREEEPPKPSTRISTLGQAATTLSTHRKSDPNGLSKLFRGELDWIVMKCLEKDRNCRYETANGLAMDIQRYLCDEPVQACPPSTLYRFRKFARRNKRVLVTLALLAMTLLTALAALTLGLLAVNREQERTQAALNREQAARAAETKRRQQARDALDEMTSLMIGDLLAKEKVLTADHKKFLRQALQAYGEFTADVAEDEEARAGVARAYWRVGSIRERLGEHQDAEIAYRDAIARFQQLAADVPAMPEHRQYLARSHAKLAGLLSTTGRAQQAEAAYGDALALLEQLATDFPAAPQYRQDLAKTYTNLGNFLQTTGRWREGEAAYGKAVRLLEGLAADFPTVAGYRHELAGTHRNLGVLLRQSSRPQEAEAAYGAALAVDQELVAAFPTVVQYREGLAKSHNELGILFHSLGRSQEAEAAFCDAIAVKKQLAADFPTVPAYRETLANSHNNLGGVLWAAGRRQEAETAHREALVFRKQLAADFPKVPAYQGDLAVSHSNLALVLLATDRKPEAEAEWRVALKVLRQLAADFPTTAEYQRALAVQYLNLGTLLRKTDRPQEAETAYREALAIHQRLAADFPKVSDYQHELAATMGNLARLLRDRKEFIRARELLEQALPHERAALEAYPGHPGYRELYLKNRGSLIETLVDLGDHSAAALTAEELVQAVVKPANDLYDAACFLARCVPLAEKDSKLAEPRRGELAHQYAGRALEILRQAVQNGYKDVDHMKKDTDLDPLRSREDFKRLLAELEARKQ